MFFFSEFEQSKESRFVTKLNKLLALITSNLSHSSSAKTATLDSFAKSSFDH